MSSWSRVSFRVQATPHTLSEWAGDSSNLSSCDDVTLTLLLSVCHTVLQWDSSIVVLDDVHFIQRLQIAGLPLCPLASEEDSN